MTLTPSDLNPSPQQPDETFTSIMAEYGDLNEDTISRWLWAIRKKQEEVEKEKQQKARELAEVEKFRNKRIEGQERAISWMLSRIQGYLHLKGETSFSAPAGRVTTVKRSKKEWADEDALIHFANEHEIAGAIKTTLKPVKSVIEKFIADNDGNFEDILTTHKVEKFYFKANAEPDFAEEVKKVKDELPF